jgi:orotate phosphoribosyltransferase
MSLRGRIAQTGAVLEGEYFFALKSGKISTKYINIDPVLTYPELLDIICGELIKPFKQNCNAIVGPAIGGIPLTYLCWKALQSDNVRGINYRTAFAEKQSDGTFAFERMGFANAVNGRKVVVVEDIATTGGSAKYTCELVEKAGGEVIGTSFIWNRGKVTPQTMGIPKVCSLITEEVQTWEAGEHPMWGKWPLVEDIGHPEKYPEYKLRIKVQNS